MATEKNTLKNWFKTGLKPTQSQFWAWLDSFWHKDEKIPLSNIDGMDKALENKAETSALDGKANVDATGLGEDNITKWKEVLGVGEVPDNMATIDQNGEQGNAYTKEQVDDLLESSGKNMANTPLTTTAQGSITQGANYTWDTAGYYFNLKNLPNKSADATFNQMLVQDSNGQVAMSNGKEIFKDMSKLLTESEKTAWKTEMNGGWTTNTMSVNAIFPPIISSSNKNATYIILKGANLNFNPSNFKVEIVNPQGGLVVEIPNSQVQLVSGIELLFYYDFSNIPVGEYKIRLSNGVATYTTATSFEITSNIQAIDTSVLNWEKITYENKPTTLSYANGGTFTMQPDAGIKPLANDSSIVLGMVSPEIVGEDSNFYAVININFNIGSTSPSNANYYIGVMSSKNTPSLSMSNILSAKTYGGNLNYYSGVMLDGTIVNYGNQSTLNIQLIIIRRDNMLIGICTANNKAVFVQKTINNSGLKIGLFATNMANSNNMVHGVIQEAYKF